MAELHVRNLPPELHDRLREQARSQGRSMSAEAVALLRVALLPATDRAAQQRIGIEQLHKIRARNQLAAGQPSAEQVVREDRDRAR